MKEIYYLSKRNMLLYIRDYVSVFFSVLSMLIVLALMVIFLGSMNSENVVSALAASGGVRDTAADERNAAWLIQMWTLAGILVFTWRRSGGFRPRLDISLQHGLSVQACVC